MLNNIVPETAAPVNPDRPRKVTCGRRTYWQSVIRLCGHDDLIDTNDPRPGAYEFASRHDIECFDCRKAAHQAERDMAPRTRYDRPSRSSAPASGTGSHRRAHTGRRQQITSKQRKIAEASALFNAALDFLAEIDLGHRKATPQAIAAARLNGARALRQLRKLGAVV